MMGTDISSLPLAEKAMIFVQAFEGFTKNATWDVNAYRLGFGSDTITFSDGFYRKVVSGDSTTPENAGADLQRRISLYFIPKVKAQVGDTTWNSLPQGAQIALVDLAYNYGSITHPSIITAAQSLNMPNLADTLVAATYNDNKSLSQSMQNGLHKRRQKEADFIRLSAASVTPISENGSAAPGILVAVSAAAAMLYFSNRA